MFGIDRFYSGLSSGNPGGLVPLGSSGDISSEAAIEFNPAAWFDGTYDKLIFDFHHIIAETAGGNMAFRISDDVGTTWLSTAIYNTMSQCIDDGGTGRNKTTTGGSASVLNSSLTLDTTHVLSGSMEFFDPSNSADNKKLFTWQMTQTDASQAGVKIAGSSRVTQTNAINAIQFFNTAGDIASGEIKVYGVKGP